MKVKRHLIVYPNSGEIWDGVNKKFLKDPSTITDEGFAKKTVEWYQNGASIIGGCCRIRPKIIEKVRE